MPIYEYTCKKCEAVIEKIHGMNENPRVKCEKCGGTAQRKISSGAVIFNGSGFYITDYGKKSQMPEKSPASPKGKPAGAPAAPAVSKRPLPKLSTDPD